MVLQGYWLYAIAMPLDPVNGFTMVVRVLDVRRVFFSNSTIPMYKIARYHRIVSFFAAKYKNSKNKILRVLHVLQNRDFEAKRLCQETYTPHYTLLQSSFCS
jgi:hypothetical protein